MEFTCPTRSWKSFIGIKLQSLTAQIRIAQFAAVCAMFVALWRKVYVLALELVMNFYG